MVAQKSRRLLNISDFLAQYQHENTREAYRSSLKRFFRLTYPDSEGISLDDLSLRYLGEDRDYRHDMLLFRENLSRSAPLTAFQRMTAIRIFLEENSITFPKRFYRNLNGRITEAIGEERVPTNEELKRIIEFMPVNGKALALLLSS